MPDFFVLLPEYTGVFNKIENYNHLVNHNVEDLEMFVDTYDHGEDDYIKLARFCNLIRDNPELEWLKNAIVGRIVQYGFDKGGAKIME